MWGRLAHRRSCKREPLLFFPVRVGGDALRFTAQLTSITLHPPLPPKPTDPIGGLGKGFVCLCQIIAPQTFMKIRFEVRTRSSLTQQAIARIHLTAFPTISAPRRSVVVQLHRVFGPQRTTPLKSPLNPNILGKQEFQCDFCYTLLENLRYKTQEYHPKSHF